MCWYCYTKKICDKCKMEYTIEESTLAMAKKDYGKCPYCKNEETKIQQENITA